jgi:hypothetical protein
VAPGQAFGVPVQTPAWQVALAEQALPSLHTAPVRAVCTQPVAGLQLSLVQALLSSQEIAELEHAPPEQKPVATWHLSATVHAAPSLCWQAPVALHAMQAPQALLVQQKPSVHEAPTTH